ncbi:MAG: HNH endonuclease [Ferruginibacter sp.]
MNLGFSKNPKWYPTNYLRPKPNELIALFQTILPNKLWYVTHLVSAIDNEISIVNNPAHPYVRQVCVIGKATSAIPINDNLWSFFKCNRGQICNIKTIERRFTPDFTPEQKQQFIWSLYNNLDPNLNGEIESLQSEPLDLETMSVIEGAERTILKLHKIRERSKDIIDQSKLLAKNQSRFYCEVCTFNFETVYPGLGNGFIECHHKQPISEGGIRKTTVNDLALVCANCHRMLHKKSEEGKYYNIEELRKQIIK